MRARIVLLRIAPHRPSAALAFQELPPTAYKHCASPFPSLSAMRTEVRAQLKGPTENIDGPTCRFSRHPLTEAEAKDIGLEAGSSVMARLS